MGEQGESRIAEARRRAYDAKQRLALGAVAAFVAVAGLAWASHPGSKATASDASSVDQDGWLVEPQDDGDDFGGFDSFGGLAPSGGAAPQAQSHVS